MDDTAKRRCTALVNACSNLAYVMLNYGVAFKTWYESHQDDVDRVRDCVRLQIDPIGIIKKSKMPLLGNRIYRSNAANPYLSDSGEFLACGDIYRLYYSITRAEVLNLLSRTLHYTKAGLGEIPDAFLTDVRKVLNHQMTMGETYQ